ncbi:MAG: GDSL-type esterase/lipase family protein, partial [Gammaproteobacteria bacterium]
RAVGVDQHYRDAELPPVNQALLDGRLAWRQHDGGHTDRPNWKYFIPWAKRELGLTPSTVAGTNLRPADVPYPRTDPNSHIAHQELLAKTQAGQIDLYFVGDSITRRWGALDYPDLLTHWNESFFGWNAANFAWGGDRTENILWRLHNGELDNVAPEVIVIQAGTNNIGGRPGGVAKVEAITAGIAAIVDRCRAQAPDAAIVLTGIFPRSEPEVVTEIEQINANLAMIAQQEGIRFLNINDELAAADGRLREGVTSDGLHLSRAGYEIWARRLQPILIELMGEPAATDNAPPATGNPAARSDG